MTTQIRNLTVLGLVVVALVGCASEPPTRRLADPPEPPPDLTRSEKLARWKGERVAILPSEFISDDFRLAEKPRGESIQEPLKYHLRIGTIVEVRESPALELVVALEGSPERLIVGKEIYLGFFGELENARTLVGKSFWALGRQHLYREGSTPLDNIRNRKPDLLEIPPGSSVTATAADWGTWGLPVRLKMRDEQGQEGWMYFGSDSACLDRRFHITQMNDRLCDPRYDFTRGFHDQDLRQLFHDWSADTWRLVREGTVAVGMTEDMVRVTCGLSPERQKVVLVEGIQVSTAYRCYDKLITVKDGRVTQVEEARP